MEEIEEVKKRELAKEDMLYGFLIFLREKKLINDFTFEFEKEISFFLYQDILEKHLNLCWTDLIKYFKNDNEKVCEVFNIINGKNNEYCGNKDLEEYLENRSADLLKYFNNDMDKVCDVLNIFRDIEVEQETIESPKALDVIITKDKLVMLYDFAFNLAKEKGDDSINKLLEIDKLINSDAS